MEHYERIDPEDKEVLSVTRLSHFERYNLAAKLLQPGSIALDAACGLGYGTDKLSRKASFAWGIDRNADAIELCRKRYGNGKVDFVVSDVWNLPFADSSIDSVVGMEMIEHIEHPGKFLAEANRVLRSKGTLFISTPYGNNTILPDGSAFSHYHIKEYRRNEMESLLEDNGFKVKKVYGQYVILGSLMKLMNKKIAPVSNVNSGSTQSIMEKLPFFAEIFSRHYPVLKRTSKNMFYYSVKSD
jgi:ubiquinone/menaquinone biosynthesis C-methylase UbiE